ncbi:MAG TPA: IPT/TIG domain-containing protein [Pirellulales bacterium]|nr:IPT/TIG domain-containing protein [Pirellulales bacterium]
MRKPSFLNQLYQYGISLAVLFVVFGVGIAVGKPFSDLRGQAASVTCYFVTSDGQCGVMTLLGFCPAGSSNYPPAPCIGGGSNSSERQSSSRPASSASASSSTPSSAPSAAPVSVWIIDDSDPQYFSAVPSLHVMNVAQAAYAGEYREALGGVYTHADWDFSGLGAGMHDVFITWSSVDNNRFDTHVPYKLIQINNDGSQTVLGTYSVDQTKQPAPDRIVGQTFFQKLATIQFNGVALLVEVSGIPTHDPVQKSYSLDAAMVAFPLSISALSPASSPAGYAVTITGTGFDRESNTVFFGTDELDNIPSYDGTHIKFTAPNEAHGTYNVSVKVGSQTTQKLVYSIVNPPASSSSSFASSSAFSSSSASYGSDKYVQINSLSPSSGPAGTQVTIAGQGFSPTGNMVHFADSELDNIPSSDGTHLTFTLPFSSVLPCMHATPPCEMASHLYQPGSYPVFVQSRWANTPSNTLTFTVTDSSSSASSVVTCSTDQDCFNAYGCKSGVGDACISAYICDQGICVGNACSTPGCREPVHSSSSSAPVGSASACQLSVTKGDATSDPNIDSFRKCQQMGGVVTLQGPLGLSQQCIAAVDCCDPLCNGGSCRQGCSSSSQASSVAVPPAGATIIDESDPRFSVLVGGVSAETPSGSNAYDGNRLVANPSASDANGYVAGQWNFGSVPAGDYDAYVTWPTGPDVPLDNWGGLTNVAVTIQQRSAKAGSTSTYNVNENTYPRADLTVGGRPFQKVGTAHQSADQTLQIIMSGFVKSKMNLNYDAVMIVPHVTCVPADCAAPPSGCQYVNATKDGNGCPLTCGNLVCTQHQQQSNNYWWQNLLPWFKPATQP